MVRSAFARLHFVLAVVFCFVFSQAVYSACSNKKPKNTNCPGTYTVCAGQSTGTPNSCAALIAPGSAHVVQPGQFGCQDAASADKTQCVSANCDEDDPCAANCTKNGQCKAVGRNCVFNNDATWVWTTATIKVVKPCPAG